MKASATRLKEVVYHLAGEIGSRGYNEKGNIAARDYILEQFTSMGYAPHLQGYDVDGRTYYNVVARYNPGQERKLIVGGHYDSVSGQPGADDNASAVAGVLETARLFIENRPEVPFTVEFVAFNLEEPPFFAGSHMGSYVHADSVKDEQVIGMVNYEMIGYVSHEAGSQTVPPQLAGTVPDTGDFIHVLGSENHTAFPEKIARGMKEAGTVPVYHHDLPEHGEFSRLSDHMNYWTHNIPAVMIGDTSFLRNPNYHTMQDLPDTLDYAFMAGVVEAVCHAVVNHLQ